MRRVALFIWIVQCWGPNSNLVFSSTRSCSFLIQSLDDGVRVWEGGSFGSLIFSGSRGYACGQKEVAQ